MSKAAAIEEAPFNYTGYGTAGSEYERTKALSRTEIARLIRADIKAAIRAKELPKLKVSVRTRSYSGGGAIDVSVTGVPEGFKICNREHVAFEVENPHACFPRDLPHYTDEAREVIAKLEAIRTKYGFSDCDGMIDYFHVRYYGGTDIDWQLTREDRERTKTELGR